MDSIADIVSVDGGGTLTLERASDGTLRVRLTSPGLVAAIDLDMQADLVVGRDPWSELRAFFRDLATNWMDAPKPITYGADDEPFGLSCDWDVAGHFHLHVRLREARHARWSATGRVELELGTLDALSRQVASLVGGGSVLE